MRQSAEGTAYKTRNTMLIGKCHCSAERHWSHLGQPGTSVTWKGHSGGRWVWQFLGNCRLCSASVVAETVPG